MKIGDAGVKECDFRVWCERCSIRIAPNEGRVALDGKTYHEPCYAKYCAAVSKMRPTSSKSRGILVDTK